MSSAPSAGDDRDHQDVDDRRRGAAPVDPAALEGVDRRVQRDREERRDERPDEHAARDPDDPEHDADGDEQHGRGDDRARAEGDDALVWAGHMRGIAYARTLANPRVARGGAQTAFRRVRARGR